MGAAETKPIAGEESTAEHEVPPVLSLDSYRWWGAGIPGLSSDSIARSPRHSGDQQHVPPGDQLAIQEAYLMADELGGQRKAATPHKLDFDTNWHGGGQPVPARAGGLAEEEWNEGSNEQVSIHSLWPQLSLSDPCLFPAGLPPRLAPIMAHFRDQMPGGYFRRSRGG
jgi:hypothetical protein